MGIHTEGIIVLFTWMSERDIWKLELNEEPTDSIVFDFYQSVIAYNCHLNLRKFTIIHRSSFLKSYLSYHQIGYHQIVSFLFKIGKELASLSEPEQQCFFSFSFMHVWISSDSVNLQFTRRSQGCSGVSTNWDQQKETSICRVVK